MNALFPNISVDCVSMTGKTVKLHALVWFDRLAALSKRRM